MNKVVLVVIFAFLVSLTAAFKIGKQYSGYNPGFGHRPGGFGGSPYQVGGGYGRPPYAGPQGNYPYYPSQQAAIHGGHGFGQYGGYGK